MIIICTETHSANCRLTIKYVSATELCMFDTYLLNHLIYCSSPKPKYSDKNTSRRIIINNLPIVCLNKTRRQKKRRTIMTTPTANTKHHEPHRPQSIRYWTLLFYAPGSRCHTTLNIESSQQAVKAVTVMQLQMQIDIILVFRFRLGVRLFLA